MGALSALNTDSLQLDYLQAPASSNVASVQSPFSEYLSPLSQDLSKDPLQNTYLPENMSKKSETEKEAEFRLFASSNEPAPKRSKKLFADGSKQAEATENKPNQAKSAKQNVTHEPAINEGKNEPRKAPSPQQVIIEGEHDEVMATLKKNVKHILNTIPSRSTAKASRNTEFIVPQEKGSAQKGSTVRVDHVSDLHVGKEKAAKHQKGLLQTTVAHLTSRNKQHVQHQVDLKPQQTEGTQQMGVKELAKGTHQTTAASTQHNAHHSLLDSDNKTSRTQKKGRSQQRSAANLLNRQETAREPQMPRFIPLDRMAEASSPQVTGQTDRIASGSKAMDILPTDSDTNTNQFGKGASKANLVTSSKGKTPTVARASRATNWLKALSERTSLLDKSNPQWKVLEMKLDNGNGSMTVRVMKEEDHVSVAVNFSDPEVKAIAETQYNEILKDLENKYQQEVRFTFGEHQQHAFESFTHQKAHGPQQRPHVQPIERPIQESQTLRTVTPSDRKVWIG